MFKTNHQHFSDICELLRVLVDLGCCPFIEPFRGPAAANLHLFCEACTPSTEVHRLVAKHTVTFLRTQLLGDVGNEPFLTPGWSLTGGPVIELFVTGKRNFDAIHEEWPGYHVDFLYQPGREMAHALKDPADRLSIPRFGQGLVRNKAARIAAHRCIAGVRHRRIVAGAGDLHYEPDFGAAVSTTGISMKLADPGAWCTRCVARR